MIKQTGLRRMITEFCKIKGLALNGLVRKCKFLSVLVISAVFSFSCLSPNADNQGEIEERLLGTWEMCDSSGKIATTGYVRCKVFTEKTFVVLELNKDNHIVDGDFIGTYTVNNDGILTETVDYTRSDLGNFQNAKNSFNVYFENDLMYLRGVNNSLNEVWKRVSD